MSIPRRIEVLGLGGSKALARAQDAATSAAAAVSSATAKATEAVAAALEAKGYRDQASTIAGLPTEAAAQKYNIENDPGVKAALSASIEQGVVDGAGAILDARVGETLTYFDDFERPDGPAGTAPSGQVYDTTGAGTPLIEGGRLVASQDGSAYAGFPLDTLPKRIAFKFVIYTTGGATTPLGLVYGDGTQVTDLITRSAHFILQRDKWSFQYREANNTITVRDGYFATPLVSGQEYLWEIVRDDDGTVTYLLDGEFLDSCWDAGIIERMGTAQPYAFIEPTRQPGEGDDAQLLESWAFTEASEASIPAGAVRNARSPFARFLAKITGDSPQLPGFDLVARKGRAQMVRIGRSLSGNLPAVVFNESADLYLVGSGPGSLRTSASIYAQAGATSQVIVGGVSGGPGFALGNAGDVILRRVAADVLACGTNDGFRPGVFTTAARPSASAFGEGTMIYDSDLDKPLWSNGTVWKDATGTAV